MIPEVMMAPIIEEWMITTMDTTDYGWINQANLFIISID